MSTNYQPDFAVTGLGDKRLEKRGHFFIEACMKKDQYAFENLVKTGKAKSVMVDG